MTQVADDYWSYTTGNGVSQTSRIIVGRPTPWAGDSQGDWICPVQIDGFTDGVATLAGVGPVDALLNAMKMVQAIADQVGPSTPRATPPRKHAVSRTHAGRRSSYVRKRVARGRRRG